MIILFFIAFFLDGVISNLISNNSFLLPLFSVVTLVVVYPYMENKKDKFCYYSFLIGLFYDITYTQTLFLNAFIFFLLAILVINIFKYFPENIINSFLATTIVIVIYRLAIWFILVIVTDLPLSVDVILKAIYNSLVLNYVYLIITYLFLGRKKRKNMSKISYLK